MRNFARTWLTIEAYDPGFLPCKSIPSWSSILLCKNYREEESFENEIHPACFQKFNMAYRKAFSSMFSNGAKFCYAKVSACSISILVILNFPFLQNWNFQYELQEVKTVKQAKFGASLLGQASPFSAKKLQKMKFGFLLRKS